MTRYLIEPRDQIFSKGHAFIKNMSKNIDKNISKTL